VFPDHAAIRHRPVAVASAEVVEFQVQAEVVIEACG
jgi:hypothetical protein